jgi:hypothetical protein
MEVVAQSPTTKGQFDRLAQLKRLAFGLFKEVDRANSGVPFLLNDEVLLRQRTGDPYAAPWFPAMKHAQVNFGDMSDYVGPTGKVLRHRAERFKFFLCVEDDAISPKTGLPVPGANVQILTLLDKDYAQIEDLEAFRTVVGHHYEHMPFHKKFAYVDMAALTYTPHDYDRASAGSVASAAQPLPDCFRPYRAMTTSRRLGMLSTYAPPLFQQLHFDPEPIDMALQACPPPERPDYVIPTTSGTALSQKRRYFAYRLRDPDGSIVDSRGDLVRDVLGEINTLDADGNLVSSYVSGCRGLSAFEGSYTETCDRTIAGITSDSLRVWEGVKLKEELPSRGYYLDGEARRLVPTNSPSEWTLGFSMCDGDTATASPAFTKTESDRTEQGTLACSASSYASRYPRGNVSRQRVIRTTTINYTRVNDPNATQTIVSTGDWSETGNDCHQYSSTTTTETKSEGAGGCLKSQRTKTVNLWDYASRSDRTETSYSSWRPSQNTCSSSNDDSGRDEKGYGYDIDGDGRADTNNRDEAIAANGGSSDGIRGIPDSCDSRCESATRKDLDRKVEQKNNDNKDNDDRGGGGGCFLTTAIVERRGEADDGPTLTALRDYRDGYMTDRADLKPFIGYYYLISPIIVDAIPEDHSDWDWVESQVDRCVRLIQQGKLSETFDVYAAMVTHLRERWLLTSY